MIELIIAIVLLGIFASLGTGAMMSLFSKGFTFNIDRENLNSGAILIYNNMSRDMRNIRDPDSITIASGNRLAFYDIDNNLLTYFLSGNTLEKKIGVVDYPLDEHCQTLNFRYYSDTENLLASPRVGAVVSTDIRVIDFTAGLVFNYEHITINIRVRPNNVEE